jgi:hypothetical protein
MPTAFVTTLDNDDSITLSVDTNGLRASTTIFLNHHLVKTLDNSFKDFFLGTNKGLKNNIVTINTQVFRSPPTLDESTVSFFIDCAGSVEPDNPTVSTKKFSDGVPLLPHFMVYNFI